MGLETKTYWLTDRQSQCMSNFDFESPVSAVHAVEWRELLGEGVTWGLLRFSPCELLLEAGSWGKGIVPEPRVRGMSAFESRYQATTYEVSADWENLVPIVVNCRMCELAITL
jgi:hypothetical protein